MTGGLIVEEFVSTTQAAEDLGMTPAQLNAWAGRHGLRRYLRTEDVEFAKATAGGVGIKATQCAVKGKDHWWDGRTRETDSPTGESLVWCGRRGCGVGVVLVKANGETKPIYRHRPV